ncbi:MAG TPA: hypothetical protein VL122_03840 [Nitrospirota bacterium]|nr:hypothetical protein [Nitrospirota bacterium]
MTALLPKRTDTTPQNQPRTLGHRKQPALIRNVTVEEDRYRIRTKSGLQVVVSSRNLAIDILRLHNHVNRVETLRHHAAKQC